MIQVTCKPREVVESWSAFKQTHDPFSIALDGYVNAPPKQDPKGPYANFDHHKGVSRVATRCTAAQVHMHINLGLFETFRMEGKPTAHIFVNDCDEDTALAIWLLQHHEQVTGHATPRINRLVACEDLLDVTAGAYPLGDTSFRRQMAWIFAPYTTARYEGRLLVGMDASGMETILEAVQSRITRHVFGDGGDELPLQGQYERLGTGKTGWALVRENGPAARLAMYADGIRAFVSLVGKGARECEYRYVIGRLSPWVWPEMSKAVRTLNKVDPNVNEQDKWGPVEHDATIGGSPRGVSSGLCPNTLLQSLADEGI